MANKGHVAWNKGLTKNTDPRVALYGKNSSETKKNHGVKVWNKGKIGVQQAWNKGIPMSKEAKEKLSKSQKNRYILNPEDKQNISDFMINYYSNSENMKNFKETINETNFRNNKIKKLTGLKRRPETIKNISISQTGKKLTEETKIKIGVSSKTTHNTDGYRKKQSELLKIVWSNPIYRNDMKIKNKLAANTPEAIKNHSRAYAHRPHKNTDIEIILENILKSLNLEYESQKYTPFGVPDFFIQPNICLFADDNYDHTRPNKQEKDVKQTQNLENNGYVVYRFWGSDLKKNPEKILVELRKLK